MGQCGTSSSKAMDIETRSGARGRCVCVGGGEAIGQGEGATLEAIEMVKWEWKLWHPEHTLQVGLAELA